MQKRRTAMFLVLMVLGAGMLAYGLHSQAATVSSDQQSQAIGASQGTQTSEPVVVPASSPVATQAVARSEAQPAGSPEVKKAPAEAPKKAAAACPT